VQSNEITPPRFDTNWTLIRAAQAGDEAARRRALEELCRIYRRVVIAALIGKHGFGHHDAEDVAQSFLAYVLLQRTFDRADAAQGRFRNFLFTFLDQFVAHHRRRMRAQKRGGGKQPVPMEELQSPSGSFPVSDPQPSPAEELDRAWARATLKEALRRLEDEYRAAGRLDEFAILAKMLDRDAHEAGYEGMAREIGISGENLRQRVSRFKKQVRAAMESVVRQTVGSAADLSAEFAYLWQCLN